MKNTRKDEVRTSYGILASIVGIFCNLLLFWSQAFIGLLVNSVSVMADAFNNLSDAAPSIIIGFIGVKMAGKPADADHPFDTEELNIFLLLSWHFWSSRWAFLCLKHLWKDPSPGAYDL